MTVTDIAAYQYSTNRVTYTSNMQAVNKLEHSVSVDSKSCKTSSKVNETRCSNADELQFLNQCMMFWMTITAWQI